MRLKKRSRSWAGSGDELADHEGGAAETDECEDEQDHRLMPLPVVHPLKLTILRRMREPIDIETRPMMISVWPAEVVNSGAM